MKTSVVACFVVMLAATSLLAQSPLSTDSLQSLKVLQTDLPVFPPDLIQIGVREGEVRVAFSVDAKGAIEDCLAIAYTHPDFARVTLAAIKHWRFEPARLRGEAIAAASEVAVHFEIQGTVIVSLTALESMSMRSFSLLESRESFRPCALRELDRIPVPIAAPSPRFPARLAAPGSAEHVIVTFFIDEEGRVRLPSIDPGNDPELAAIAIDALRTWQFEPPTRKGRPVLVRASQRFNFRAVPAKPASATNS